MIVIIIVGSILKLKLNYLDKIKSCKLQIYIVEIYNFLHYDYKHTLIGV